MIRVSQRWKQKGQRDRRNSSDLHVRKVAIFVFDLIRARFVNAPPVN